MSWRDEAACRGRNDIDWFPVMDRPGGQGAAWRDNLARAREVCSSCSVTAECMAEAATDPLTGGIWAGTTEAQRRQLPAQARRRPPVARCGTDAGYYRHLRYTDTEPCQECKEAHAMAWRLRKHRLAVVR